MVPVKYEVVKGQVRIPQESALILDKIYYDEISNEIMFQQLRN